MSQSFYIDKIVNLADTQKRHQTPIGKDELSDKTYFLKENMMLQVASYKDKIIDVELPITVDLEVTDTQPGFKGDTVTAGTKPATLETGLVVNVPMFVDIGDVIKVDTRNGNYLERA